MAEFFHTYGMWQSARLAVIVPEASVMPLQDFRPALTIPQ
jgi:hypothetical protein